MDPRITDKGNQQLTADSKTPSDATAFGLSDHGTVRDTKEDELKDTGEEAEGTDSETSENESAQQHSNLSELRRQQTAKFKSWYVHGSFSCAKTLTKSRFTKRVEAISKEETRVVEGQQDDEDHTTRYILSRQESDGIITDPREYQLELFERAKQQNTIAVLDTGKVLPDHDCRET